MVSATGPRFAILGGGRSARRQARQARQDGHRVRVYGSTRDAGRGETRRLCESLRRGGIDRVVIMSCFNGHSAARAVRALCEQLAVPCCFVERPAELPTVFGEM